MLTPMEKGGYVYILSSKGKRLYTGVTAQLRIRVLQHRRKVHMHSFTARYNIDSLVYFECFETITEAIARESRIKNMHRVEKIAMIVASNPDWCDLSAGWDKPMQPFDEAAMGAAESFRSNTEILAAPE